MRFHRITGEVSWHPTWKRIKSMGVIDTGREYGDTISHERRLYVSSLLPGPELFATSSRAHWGIEHSLYYVLEVVFREDGARITSGEAPENRTYFRKLRMMVARVDRESTSSIKSRVKQMAWSDE